MEMTRALMKSMRIPGRFWAEAVRHAVYLINRLPTKAMGSRTPYEAWNGKRPHIGHLRIFGCKGHVKTVKPHLKKLDDRSVQMVYFGIEEGSKAHRMFNPQTNTIVVSRDVVFEETVMWDWDAVENTEIADAMEMGQWNSNIDLNYDGMPMDDHQVDQNARNDVGQNSVAGGDAAAAQSVGQIETDQNPAIEMQADSVQHSDQGSGWNQEMVDAMDSDDYDESPQRFRSLNEIYQDSQIVDLSSDSEEENNAEAEEQVNAVEVAALLSVMEEPTSFREAVDDPNWVLAMESEMQSICKNGTWELATLPPGQKAIGLKWIFKLKKNADGEVVKHKARLVAKGYVQQEGVDFDEVFAPVARLDTIRLILALAANRGWQVHHLDVKTAFLNGELEENVYVA